SPGSDVGKTHPGVQYGCRVEALAVVGIVAGDDVARIGHAEGDERGSGVFHAVVDEFDDDPVQDDFHVGVEPFRLQVRIETDFHLPVRIDGDGLVDEVADRARQSEGAERVRTELVGYFPDAAYRLVDDV